MILKFAYLQEIVELRLKPKLVKIKFLDNTFQQIAFDPYMLIKEVLNEIGDKLGLDKGNISDYGLLLETPKEADSASSPRPQNSRGNFKIYRLAFRRSSNFL